MASNCSTASALKAGRQLQGAWGSYLVSKKVGDHGDVWQATDIQKNPNVIVKAAPHYALRSEREVLQRFQATTPLRRLIDQIDAPPSLVLEYLDSNLLVASGRKALTSPELKQVAKTILQALAAMHEEGMVHTGMWSALLGDITAEVATHRDLVVDIKPDNILVNHGIGSTRFRDIKLADCGDSSHVDEVVPEHIIGATIFRSPEAMLNLIWGTATDIWSLGATLISLKWGYNFHIFKPQGIDYVDAEEEQYPIQVMRRIEQFFGPYPLSYTSFAGPEELDMIAAIAETVQERKPFEYASAKEIAKEDKDFILRLMKLDPRDRPSAKSLLQDPWLSQV